MQQFIASNDVLYYHSLYNPQKNTLQKHNSMHLIMRTTLPKQQSHIMICLNDQVPHSPLHTFRLHYLNSTFCLHYLDSTFCITIWLLPS